MSNDEQTRPHKKHKQHDKHHHITMVVEPLAPPAVWN
jgi:hypothetical protein